MASLQSLRNNNAMGERQQPTNSGLLATHLARRWPDALGEAAGALSEQGTALRLLMAPASTLGIDVRLVVQLAIRPFDPQRCLMRDLG